MKEGNLLRWRNWWKYWRVTNSNVLKYWNVEMMKILTCHKQRCTQILKYFRLRSDRLLQRSHKELKLEYWNILENWKTMNIENWKIEMFLSPLRWVFLKISQRAENRQDFRLKVQVISNSTIDFGNAASSKTRILYAVIHKQDMLHKSLLHIEITTYFFGRVCFSDSWQ